MSGGGVVERQVRSDKRVDVKPTMSMKLKEELYQFANLCDLTVKEVAEQLCVLGMTSREVMTEISKWLRRDYRYNNTIVLGYSERPKLTLTMRGETGKVTTRLKQSDYDRLKDLAHALDLTPSSTATVLIRIAFKNTSFMNDFVDQFVDVDEQQAIKIKMFIQDVCKSK